jgi:hypothetical protein
VERKFATLYSRSRAILNGAKLTQELRDLMWAEVSQTRTEQQNVNVTKRKAKSPYDLFYGKDFAGLAVYETIWRDRNRELWYIGE